ncbi:MAG: hydroxymethylglutaryl-CoA synthase [Candidatus Ranarchaeia archaeon]
MLKPIRDVGIVGWGAYVPRNRIKVEEIARMWGKDPVAWKRGLFVNEKAVPEPDEDTATISVEASKNALTRTNIDPKDIGAIYIGSESHPYAVKPTGTIVGEAIGATPDLLAGGLEFACKAGTEGMQICIGLVASGMIKYGLGIGADTAQGAPGDPLEFTAAGGGAAFIIGLNDENCAAKFEQTYSFATDTPDFWRREAQPYPKHGEAFTGKPAYFKHVISAGKGLMKLSGTEPSDYNYVTFHQPNGKFPINAAKILGFSEEQYSTGLLAPSIGNTYSGATPLGLAACLDVAKPGERILAVSYGSGAGSDAFDVIVQDSIVEKQKKARKVQDYIKRKVNIDYAIYTKYRNKIIMG